MSDEAQQVTHHLSRAGSAGARDDLRIALRNQRKAIPHRISRNAARAVARNIARAHLLRAGHAIGVYVAFDGEIDLTPLMHAARRARCIVYAPRILDMRRRKMEFVEIVPRPARLTTGNAFSWHVGRQRHIDVRRLDVILVPLVAFDVHGWRLGFGAGFYDRKLAFMRRRIRRQPLLIGVAYEMQCVAPQVPESWDVPMHAVVTERGLHRCR